MITSSAHAVKAHMRTKFTTTLEKHVENMSVYADVQYNIETRPCLHLFSVYSK